MSAPGRRPEWFCTPCQKVLVFTCCCRHGETLTFEGACIGLEVSRTSHVKVDEQKQIIVANRRASVKRAAILRVAFPSAW